MEPVKGSPQISLQKAAFWQSRPHRVSFLSSASYTPTSLDGVSLDSRVASLPYESSSLAHPAPLRGPLPLKGTQDVTGLPSCYINHTVLSAELATSGGLPLSRFAGLLHGKASHTILRSLPLPYESCSLATLFRGENRLLYTFL